MMGRELAVHRREKGMTQETAAKRLGVSQTYLSLLEAERRRVTLRLTRRATSVFGLSPSNLPAHFEQEFVSDDRLAVDLAGLGYPGFSHLKKRAVRKNPAVVLFNTLNADKRDPRLVEALPWLLLNFTDLDWNSLSRNIKANDLQNRLGFLVAVSSELAERQGSLLLSAELRLKEVELSRSLLVHEDTLCNETMTVVERKWLKSNRSSNAKRWHVLTDMRAEGLKVYE